MERINFRVQFADVNAFLTLAATRHTLLPEDLREKPRVNEIVNAARAGRVPVHLVSGEFGTGPKDVLLKSGIRFVAEESTEDTA
jgi:hypothetical protein